VGAAVLDGDGEGLGVGGAAVAVGALAAGDLGAVELATAAGLTTAGLTGAGLATPWAEVAATDAAGWLGEAGWLVAAVGWLLVQAASVQATATAAAHLAGAWCRARSARPRVPIWSG
jgi:hypothetical protein